jgi:mono/diheme cytochrome c family protein
MIRVTLILVPGFLQAWALLPCHAGEANPPNIAFNRDIRPILSENCFQCHGPDANQRKAKLRLDTGEGAFQDRGGRRVLTPGKPDGSELYRRITTVDPAEHMPPAKSGKQLSPREINLLRRWVEQGAKWEKHWAYLPPRRSPPPSISSPGQTRNAIDAFILERLEREGLTLLPEADKTTLIRRVSLDLTGLPPTPSEVDAFLADESPNAYERVVDRLFASPRYGERMARPWLDAARYADTNGYQTDGERFMWRWRDWVIDAFNRNMPFDQFTIEQLAGDMLPGATLPQRIATGFNRNHRGNGEGGIVPEEYAIEYVVDRVDTTATVWLGSTFGCARCHDHKFDPITQKEFYQLFAYFNNVPEKGKAIKYGNSPPLIKAPTREQQQQLRELEDRLVIAERHFAELEPRLRTELSNWERSLQQDRSIDWSIETDLSARFTLDETDAKAKVRFVDGESAFAAGRLGQAARFDGRRHIDAGDVAKFGFYDKFTLAAWILPEGDAGGTIVSRMVDRPQAEGYAMGLKDGKLQVNLVKRWLDDAIRIESEARLPKDGWRHVAVTYDGSREAAGVKLYIDGEPAKVRVLLDDLNQSFDTKEPLRIGAGGGPEARFRGLIDELRIYHDALDAEVVRTLAAAESITKIAALPPEKRTPPQAAKLHAYFREHAASPPIREAWREVSRLRKERTRFAESIPTTMVMEELPAPRPTFVLQRGAYDKPAERVAPAIPAALADDQKPSPVPANRLEFARWLMNPSNPLTARVAVNRLWQMHFGTGLVRTPEDFGVQGAWPSHPELLDWLATEFMRTGWDVKAMQRLMVTSATYRQSSRVTPALLQKDPENRLLARGPRLRLPAEMVRDQALAASGLLVERLGGPSVKPYQPAGLWKELTGTEDYVQDHGPSLYRRGLYTFWKRTVPPPVMVTFDAAGRETCIVRETRTNTPLQALNLMNDVTYAETARVLAQRIMTEAGPPPEERIALAFRLLTARRPNLRETKILMDAFDHHLAEYRKDLTVAVKLTSAGESPRDEKLDVAEWAAYTAVAGMILNLDEAVTRE